MFDPVGFFQLAEDLHGSQTSNEAHIRSAISRAYYASFLCARNAAGITGTSSDTHQKVSEHYLKNKKAKLANQLKSLRIKRNDADYDTSKTLQRRDSGEALRLAREILEGLGHPPVQSPNPP